MSTQNLEAPAVESIADTEATKTAREKIQKYTTVLGTLHDGKVILPEDMEYPNDTPVLVTVLIEPSNGESPADYENYTDEQLETMTVGEQVIAGLKDIVTGRYTTINNQQEMEDYLDRIFEEE